MFFFANVMIATIAISSCGDNTDDIGQSITNTDEIIEIDSPKAFPVETQSYVADSVFTQSGSCYLGLVRDPETQTDVKSEFTTQFHLLDVIKIPQADKFVSVQDGLPIADSCDVILYLSNPFNASDSLSSIKMNVFELATTMEPDVKYYSNFNPISHGMVKTGGLNKSKVFSYLNLTDQDTTRAKSTYLNNIRVALNEQYIANGDTCNNYGTYIIRQYHKHPEYFRNSYAFSHHVCPGLYFEVNDGYGFHAKVSNIGLRIFYRYQGDTAVVNSVITLAGTREVQQNTFITNDAKAIQQLVDLNPDKTYIKSPAGLFTEATLPVKEIFSGHENDSLIASRITFQRINNESSDMRMFGIPQTLLMVHADSLTSFFEGNSVPDSQTSFYTNFNYISSSYSATNTYNFANIIPLIKYMWKKYQEGVNDNSKEGIVGNPNWENEHPNWNKVLLVPITYTSGSSTSVEHDMSLTSTKLVKGTKNSDSPVKIQVVYAKSNN